MMWMMVVCCALPLVILLFAGGKLFSAGYIWPILIGVMIAGYLWMMFRGHGSCGKNHKNNEEKDNS